MAATRATGTTGTTATTTRRPTETATPPTPKAMAWRDVRAELRNWSGLTHAQLDGVFEGLETIIGRELGKKGPGVFVLGSLMKLRTVRRPATRAKQGINPFNKQPMTIKAKPARNVVKVKVLKGLDEMV